MLLAKQDAHEQKQKLDCLILRGPLIPNVGEVCTKVRFSVKRLINNLQTKEFSKFPALLAAAAVRATVYKM